MYLDTLALGNFCCKQLSSTGIYEIIFNYTITSKMRLHCIMFETTLYLSSHPKNLLNKLFDFLLEQHW